MAGPAQYLYRFLPGDRPELATDPEAWTDEDSGIGERHFAYLQAATRAGTLVLAGRSLDGIGPAIVVFEAESPEEARRFMEGDPFVQEGLFGAELHPFRAALMRGD
jgi:uncharacterized protein YciI